MNVRQRGMYAGVSGNVLINEQGNRLQSYHVWNYAEGYDSFYRSMLVDLTQPPGKVSGLFLSITILFMTLFFHFSVFSVCQQINPIWMKFSRAAGVGKSTKF